jgi:hypothetical protein
MQRRYIKNITAFWNTDLCGLIEVDRSDDGDSTQL